MIKKNMPPVDTAGKVMAARAAASMPPCRKTPQAFPVHRKIPVPLELALQASGMDQATVMDPPRLLSDNGSSHVSGDLAKWLDRQDMRHTRGAPYHPMTQGKIERWHQTLKNRILLENDYLPGDLEAQINAVCRVLQPPALSREHPECYRIGLSAGDRSSFPRT